MTIGQLLDAVAGVPVAPLAWLLGCWLLLWTLAGVVLLRTDPHRRQRRRLRRAGRFPATGPGGWDAPPRRRRRR